MQRCLNCLDTSSKGAIIRPTGKRRRESRLTRKEETMKLPSLCAHAHANQIHTTYSAGPRASQDSASVDWQADGRSGLACGRSALAQVHQSEQFAINEFAYALRDDGPARTGQADARARAEPYACGRRHDRVGHAVGDSSTDTFNVRGHVSPAIIEFIARDAIKRAALALTPSDALDIAGEALLALACIAQREVSHG